MDPVKVFAVRLIVETLARVTWIWHL